MERDWTMDPHDSVTQALSGLLPTHGWMKHRTNAWRLRSIQLDCDSVEAICHHQEVAVDLSQSPPHVSSQHSARSFALTREDSDIRVQPDPQHSEGDATSRLVGVDRHSDGGPRRTVGG